MTNLIRIFTVAGLATGLMLAQPGPGRHRRAGMGMMHGMGQRLELTEGQKVQAKEIFQAARAEAKPLREQLKQARQQLHTDIQAGAAQETITQDANRIGTLTAQLTVQRAKTQQQFNALLTADQKAKLEQMKQRMQERRQSRQNRRNAPAAAPAKPAE